MQQPGSRAPAGRRVRLGWCLYDWANSAFATIVLAGILPVYFVRIVPEAGARLPLVNHTLKASVLWSYSVSLSMFLVAVAAPYVGALGDRSGRHPELWAGFCLLGSLATSLLALAGYGDYFLAAGLFILANWAFAAGNIFTNAYLPAFSGDEDIDRLSAYGFGLGYIGGGIALLLAVILIYYPGLVGLAGRGAGTRAGFVLAGLWWAGFGMLSFSLMRGSLRMPPSKAVPHGLVRYARLFAELKRYPDLLLFLVAFLIYNDGIQTIITVSAIFARDVLGLSTGTVLGCFLMVQFVAMPGSLLFALVAERLGTKRAIGLSLLVFMGITVYAFFIDTALEFWIMGFAVALVLGGSQTASRSLFGSMVPRGKYAEFFGFYTLSHKFSSIMGPFLFALIADATGSERASILVLNILFLAGLALLLKVDVFRGRSRAREEG